MQQLTQPIHLSPPPGQPARRGNSWPVLTLWAAFFCVGAVVGGCGIDPLDLDGTTNPVLSDTDPTLTCFTETQGGPTSCKDEATWSAYGSMACAGKGAMLTSIKFGASCGRGLYSSATYECCTGAPPPRMCMWSPATGVGACQQPDAWKKEGTTFCAAHGLDLNDVKLDRPCAMGGYAAAQFECCSKSPPPPPPVCSTESLASMSCVDDGTWKTKIEATCKAKGQTVGTVGFGRTCMGGHLEVKFTCCGPTPPPPPPPPACTDNSLASMSCVDDGTWKTRIEATCKAKGQTVGTVSFGRACMGGHLEVRFTCCGATPPPPPVCVNEAMGSRTCVDDVTWKTRAADACTSRKLTLTAMTYGMACMGGHQDIQFTCCGVTPPPPPPPPTCSAEGMGSMSCVDDGTWKTKIEATCKAKGQTVGSVTFGRACMGGHLDVQFTCCGPTPPPPACTTETAASMSCVDDGTWKTRADAACAAKKLTLTRLAFGKVCMGGHQDITFSCCGVTPPPPPVCSHEKAPSTGTCHSPDQWKVAGERVCAAKGQSLAGISMSGACMGGFSSATFECCGATPPPPPPTCSAGVVGDGRSCVAETALKSQAEAICKMAGARLTAFSPYDLCGALGAYLHAKYECCR